MKTPEPLLRFANSAKGVPRSEQDVQQATRGSKPGPEPHEKAKIVSHVLSSRSGSTEVISAIRRRLLANDLHESPKARQRAYKALELLIHCLGHCSYAFASECSSSLLHSVVKPINTHGPQGLRPIAGNTAYILESEDALLEHKDKCAKTAARLQQPMPGSDAPSASDLQPSGSESAYGNRRSTSYSKWKEEGEGAGEAADEASDYSNDDEDDESEVPNPSNEQHVHERSSSCGAAPVCNGPSSAGSSRSMPKVSIKAASSSSSSAKHSPAPSLNGPINAGGTPTPSGPPSGAATLPSDLQNVNNVTTSKDNNAGSGGDSSIDLLDNETSTQQPQQQPQQKQDPFISLL
jgi:hypothetical protein